MRGKGGREADCQSACTPLPLAPGTLKLACRDQQHVAVTAACRSLPRRCAVANLDPWPAGSSCKERHNRSKWLALGSYW